MLAAPLRCPLVQMNLANFACRACTGHDEPATRQHAAQYLAWLILMGKAGLEWARDQTLQAVT